MTDQINIVSVSGGKDSTALYCLAVEFFGNNFLPIFADTDNEHPVTINYVKNLHLMAGGPEVVIVHPNFDDKLIKKGIEPSGNKYLDMMLWKGRAPSAKAQFCTEWLKLEPILHYLETNYSTYEWIMFTGIRAGESQRRAKMFPFNWNTYFDCEQVLPMLYQTEEEIFSYLEEKGVPPNPLYALGFNRVGCFPCIHCNKNEVSKLPEWVWDKLTYWEQRIGRTFFGPGIVPGKYIATAADVRMWSKTSYGGSQFNLFITDAKDAPACLSTWGICE